MEDRIDLVYRLLDVQIVDVNGRRCGRVDDIELRGAPGDALEAVALLTGHGTYPSRLPQRLRGAGRRVFGPGVLGDTILRIPWECVEDVDAVVHLRVPAAELGLAAGDRDLERWMAKVPGR